MNDKKEEICPTTGCSYRDWAIATGDAWRNLNENIFVDILKDEYKTLSDQFDDDIVVLIDDLRYDNEAQAIKDMGGIIIKLKRDGISYKMDHATEKPVDLKFVDYDCHVDAAKGIVERIVSEYRGAEAER